MQPRECEDHSLAKDKVIVRAMPSAVMYGLALACWIVMFNGWVLPRLQNAPYSTYLPTTERMIELFLFSWAFGAVFWFVKSCRASRNTHCTVDGRVK